MIYVTLSNLTQPWKNETQDDFLRYFLDNTCLHFPPKVIKSIM